METNQVADINCKASTLHQSDSPTVLCVYGCQDSHITHFQVLLLHTRVSEEIQLAGVILCLNKRELAISAILLPFVVSNVILS